eukprot:9418878-Karenia_brevis.AAC.1
MDQPQGHRKSRPYEQSERGSRPEKYYIGEGTEAEGNQQGQGDSVALSMQCSPRAEDPEPRSEL